MKSPHVTDLLTAYMDGTLDAKQLERVKSHMIFCHACRTVLSDLQDNQKLLKSIPNVEPPEDLAGSILKAVIKDQEEIKKASEKDTLSFPLSAWLFSQKGLATAATCIIVGIVVWNFPEVKSKRDQQISIGQSKTEPKDNPAVSLEEAPAESVVDRLDKDSEIAELNAPIALRDSIVAKSEKLTLADDARLYNKEGLVSEMDDKSGVRRKRASEKGLIARNLAPPVAAKKAKNQNRWRAEPESARGNLQRMAGTVQKQADFTGLSGTSSGIKDPLTRVISSKRQWKKLWRNHNSNRKPTPELPPVDFDKDQIIVIFAGNTPTGGSSVEILNIEDSSWEGEPARIVTYRINQAPAGGMVTMAESQPFTMKLLPKIDGKTFFKQK